MPLTMQPVRRRNQSVNAASRAVPNTTVARCKATEKYRSYRSFPRVPKAHARAILSESDIKSTLSFLLQHFLCQQRAAVLDIAAVCIRGLCFKTQKGTAAYALSNDAARRLRL